MKSTKDKILNTSRVLFNTFGYSNVTIRMIAKALQMSSGNLNYHFKKRDQILEAIYFEMVATFDQRIEDLETQTPTLKKMQQEIYSSMKRMVAYKFFWTDLYNLLQINEPIKVHFDAVYERRKNGLSFVFDQLIATNMIKEFESEQQRIFLIERMITYSNTWLYASMLYSKKEFTQQFVLTQTNTLMAFLYPYLSAKGKNDYQAL